MSNNTGASAPYLQVHTCVYVRVCEHNCNNILSLQCQNVKLTAETTDDRRTFDAM